MGSLLAIDPGYTTGVAIAQPGWGYTNDRKPVFDCTAGVVEWADRFWFHRYITANYLHIEAIIIERFKLFNNAKTINAQINSEFPSVRVIGIVECAAYEFGLLDKIVYQDPAQRKGVTIPETHHSAVGQSDHAKDAYRHLRYFILAHKRSNTR